MTKQILSKEPIYADKSAELLKGVAKKLLQALDKLNLAIGCISKNLIGEEFNAACEYIKKINLDIVNSNNNDINEILSRLTDLVNEYNSDIKDAEGNPYPCKTVNYASSSISDNDILTSGGVISSDSNSKRNNNINDDTFSSSETPPENTQQDNNLNNDDSNNQPNNELFDNLINYSLTSGMELNSSSSFYYNDVEYNWNEVVKQFLQKENLSNVISDISIKDGLIKCFMLNGQSFVLDNVFNYNDLKTAIVACVNELV